MKLPRSIFLASLSSLLVFMLYLSNLALLMKTITITNIGMTAINHQTAHAEFFNQKIESRDSVRKVPLQLFK